MDNYDAPDLADVLAKMDLERDIWGDGYVCLRRVIANGVSTLFIPDMDTLFRAKPPEITIGFGVAITINKPYGPYIAQQGYLSLSLAYDGRMTFRPYDPTWFVSYDSLRKLLIDIGCNPVDVEQKIEKLGAFPR